MNSDAKQLLAVLLSTNPYGASGQAHPLACCGDWAVYIDDDTARPFYARRSTGNDEFESLWEPPCSWDDAAAHVPALAELVSPGGETWRVYRDTQSLTQYFTVVSHPSLAEGHSTWAPPPSLVRDGLLRECEGALIAWEADPSFSFPPLAASGGESPGTGDSAVDGEAAAYQRAAQRVRSLAASSPASPDLVDATADAEAPGRWIAHCRWWDVYEARAPSEVAGCLYYHRAVDGHCQWHVPDEVQCAPDAEWCFLQASPACKEGASAANGDPIASLAVGIVDDESAVGDAGSGRELFAACASSDAEPRPSGPGAGAAEPPSTWRERAAARRGSLSSQPDLSGTADPCPAIQPEGVPKPRRRSVAPLADLMPDTSTDNQPPTDTEQAAIIIFSEALESDSFCAALRKPGPAMLVKTEAIESGEAATLRESNSASDSSTLSAAIASTIVRLAGTTSRTPTVARRLRLGSDGDSLIASTAAMALTSSVALHGSPASLPELQSRLERLRASRPDGLVPTPTTDGEEPVSTLRRPRSFVLAALFAGARTSRGSGAPCDGGIEVPRDAEALGAAPRWVSPAPPPPLPNKLPEPADGGFVSSWESGVGLGLGLAFGKAVITVAAAVAPPPPRVEQSLSKPAEPMAPYTTENHAGDCNNDSLAAVPVTALADVDGAGMKDKIARLRAQRGADDAERAAADQAAAAGRDKAFLAALLARSSEDYQAEMTRRRERAAMERARSRASVTSAIAGVSASKAEAGKATRAALAALEAQRGAEAKADLDAKRANARVRVAGIRTTV